MQNARDRLFNMFDTHASPVGFSFFLVDSPVSYDSTVVVLPKQP